MRCAQVRRRITDRPDTVRTDDMIRRHITDCRKCARFLAAEQQLDRSFETMERESEASSPLSLVRRKVEARIDSSARPQIQENSFMSHITRQLRTRPRTMLSIGVVATAILVMTLIPFRVDQTIGYEVAVAGVNKDLAFDDNRLSELLTALEIPETHLPIGDCDATCRVTFREIQSESQARMLVAAFEELNGVTVEYVVPVDSAQNLTLIQKARKSFPFGPGSSTDERALHRAVKERIERLHQQHDGEFNLFFTDKAHNHVLTEELQGGSVDEFRLEHDSTGSAILEFKDNEGNVTRATKAELESRLWHEKKAQANMPFGDEAAAKQGENETLPEGFALSQNYPNPFNPSTTIDFTLPQAAQVTLRIFNINGQRVRTLIEGERSAGTHRVEWDATSDSGRQLASGVYLYRLSAGDQVATKKMTLLK